MGTEKERFPVDAPGLRCRVLISMLRVFRADMPGCSSHTTTAALLVGPGRTQYDRVWLFPALRSLCP
jgi:hypothetical protein